MTSNARETPQTAILLEALCDWNIWVKADLDYDPFNLLKLEVTIVCNLRTANSIGESEINGVVADSTIKGA